MGNNFSENLDSFGKRLKYAREKAGIKQKEIADKLGKSKPQIISAWENDKNEPSLKEVRVLAELLNTTVGFLVDGEDVTGGNNLRDQLYEVQSKLNIANELLVQYQQKELEAKKKEIEDLKHQ